MRINKILIACGAIVLLGLSTVSMSGQLGPAAQGIANSEAESPNASPYNNQPSNLGPAAEGIMQSEEESPGASPSYNNGASSLGPAAQGIQDNNNESTSDPY